MPDWKKIHEFVSYVQDYNTKDDDEDEATLGNLADPNYADIKAIKEDNALRKFKDKTGYDKVKVADIYKMAKHLKLVVRRTSDDSAHVTGVILLVTEDGKEFIHKSKRLKLKTGKWHAVAKYYVPWQTAVAVFALVASIIGIVISIIALNKST